MINWIKNVAKKHAEFERQLSMIGSVSESNIKKLERIKAVSYVYPLHARGKFFGEIMFRCLKGENIDRAINYAHVEMNKRCKRKRFLFWTYIKYE